MTTTWTEPPRDWTAGELVTESIADTHIRDQFKATWHCIAKKSADESVTSSATEQDDNDLLIAATSGDIWLFDAPLIFDGATGGDFRWRWTFPSGSLIQTVDHYIISDGTTPGQVYTRATASPTGTFIAGTLGAADPRLLVIHGFYTAGSTGNLQLQWAQGTSSGTATILRTGSSIWGAKLV